MNAGGCLLKKANGEGVVEGELNKFSSLSELNGFKDEGALNVFNLGVLDAVG